MLAKALRFFTLMMLWRFFPTALAVDWKTWRRHLFLKGKAT
jgi:hypothetical protein